MTNNTTTSYDKSSIKLENSCFGHARDNSVAKQHRHIMNGGVTSFYLAVMIGMIVLFGYATVVIIAKRVRCGNKFDDR